MVGVDSRSPSGDEADARRIQRFLEAAAPLILESRSLDGARFDSVVELAERMGVGSAELRRELRWLARRGVILSAPWEKLEPAKSRGRESAPQQLHADVPPAERRTAPPPVRSPSAPRTEPGPVRDVGPIGQSGVGVPPVRADDPAKSASPRTTEEPERESGAPADRFSAWLDKQLAVYPSALLAEDDERSLIGVGVHRHHLAEVLARHIVRDVAARFKMRLERDLAGASEHSTVAATGSAADDDETLRKFFDQVAPILALHRGINTQSRILLSAVGQQMGLTEDQFDRAIAQLQQSPSQSDGEDPRQAERLDAYRRYLRRAIAQLSDSIITFRTQQRLEEAGEYFHGVEPALIVPTIKEVASEVGARFLSRQQATEHVATLINDVWARGLTVTGETRVRIYAEGTRWGLEPMDIEAVLRAQTQARRAQSALERRRVRRLVLLTATVLVCVAAFFAWLLWPAGANPFLVKTDQTAAPRPRPKVERPTDWRSADLRIAIANFRSTLPDKKPLLTGIDAKLPSARATTYQNLVRTAIEEPDDPAVRDVIGPLLVNFYACDPSEAACETLANSLLEPVLAARNRVPSTPAAVETLFWACRTALRTWRNSALSEQRAEQFGQMLQTAIGMKLDRQQDAHAMQQACLAVVTKRLYDLMIRLATDQPELVERLYGVIADQATRCLDDTTRDQLDITLLGAILPAVGDRWSTFHDTIRHLTRSRDPRIVLKMAKIHRQITDPLLRTYLAGLFSERLGVDLQTLPSDAFEDRVRSLLGIADTEKWARQWSTLVERARAKLDDAPIAGTHAEVLLDDAVELAYLATLACALDQEELGKAIYTALESAGPPKLDMSAGPWAGSVPGSSPAAPSLSTAKFVEKYVTDLRGARLALQRIRLLRMIANYVDRTPDISMQAGQALAQYLAHYKTDISEQQAVLKVAGRFGQWNSVRLGLADLLIEAPGRNKQLTDLFTAVLGSPTSLDSATDRLKTRRALMRTVADQLATERPAPHTLGPVFGQAEKALTDLYKKQADLLGVSAESLASAQRPSAVLTSLLAREQERLEGVSLEPADRAFLQRLDQELKAARFVVDDDLEYTVLVAHLWARSLAMRVTGDNAKQRPHARELIARMEQLDRRSENIFEQFRHIHAILLELWLLRRPAGADAGGG